MPTMHLDQDSRIVIIGGGPAGSLFAVHLLRLLDAHNLSVGSITIVDSKRDFARYGRRGCNLCAGVLTSSLVDRLSATGFDPSRIPGLIQRRLTGYLMSTASGQVVIPNLSPWVRIYSVNRGRGPDRATTKHAISFDLALLQYACRTGHVEAISATVSSIRRSRAGGPFIVELAHEQGDLIADLLIIACGVNSDLLARVSEGHPGFVAPEMCRAAQMEIPLPPREILQLFRDRAVIVTSTGLPRVRMVAVTPKCRHLTLTVIGLDRWFRWEPEMLHDIFALFRQRGIIPQGVTLAKPRCRCEPVFPSWPAQNPFADRLAVIGDASGLSRFLKNGIESAYVTALYAAEAVVQHGIDERTLRERYYQRALAIHRDNRFGRLVDRIYRLIQNNPMMERALFELIEREPPHGSAFSSPVRWSLWNLFSGVAPYRKIWQHFLSPSVQMNLTVITLSQLLRRSNDHRGA